MLIEFTVENFRSFAGPQTLSLIAGKEKGHPENVVERGPHRLLKSAAIYGANASGKSNLIKAVRCMERFVGGSATKMNLGDPIPGMEPFRLDKALREQPCRFQVQLFLDGVEYLYGFSASRERVHDEWLHVRRKGGRATTPFAREFDPSSGETRWDLQGDLREQAKGVVEKTRDNGLFLSRAAEMNVALVTDLFLWFRKRVWCLDLSFPPIHLIQQTADRIQHNPAFRVGVARLVHDADMGIDGLSASLERLVTHEMPGTRGRLEHFVVQTHHRVQGSPETVEFSLEEDESLGTQRFFALMGPVLDALDEGRVLVADELDCSMHPLLVRKLVELFHSPEANRGGAQLVFATHDTSLMTAALFRRDQLWLTEKNSKGATELFSLCDIEPEKRPRRGEAFQRNYLSGRYGGVPSFGPALEDHEVR